jgi:hypothetical protein
MLQHWYRLISAYDRLIARWRIPRPPEVNDQLDKLTANFWKDRR